MTTPDADIEIVWGANSLSANEKTEIRSLVLETFRSQCEYLRVQCDIPQIETHPMENFSELRGVIGEGGAVLCFFLVTDITKKARTITFSNWSAGPA